MKNYSEITVFISPGREGRYDVRVSSDEGGQCHSTLELPFTLRDFAAATSGAAASARAIGSLRPSAVDGRSAADFGADLFDALFQGEARDLLVATDSRAQGSVDTGVRIRLSMDLQAPGMAEVASLPWELMCRRGQRPLVVSMQTPLVRSLDVARPVDPRPFVAPLRILVLMANPSDTAQLDLEREKGRIEQNWARLPGVEVDYVKKPVRAAVLDQLAEKDYHVVHYMGHGDFEAQEGGLLLLENEDGSKDPITGDEFAAWLADEPLRLVFLNACKTGATAPRDGSHPFAGVATALIRERVPAVVAMQFPISDDAAIVFAQTFYARIAQGLPVEAAVSEGRKALYSSRNAEWATPVLYLRAKDGRLFSLPEAAPPPVVAARPAEAAPGPWGDAGPDTLRIYLATTDQDREKLHAQLAQALRAVPGVQVVDAVPLDDSRHPGVVDRLVREADLCVHLLGANAGRRVDVDDGDPLRTYPLVELDIARRTARAQLVLMTREDQACIANPLYKAYFDELATRPREQARFELVVADKTMVPPLLLERIGALKAARAAAASRVGAGPGVPRKAFIDAHVSDQEHALDLSAYLEDHEVDTTMSTSSSSGPADLARLEQTVKRSDLYVIVAGTVDRSWVSHRKQAVRKSVVKARAALLVASYSAAPPDVAGAAQPTGANLDISTFNDSDRSWVDALFPPAEEGRP